MYEGIKFHALPSEIRRRETLAEEETANGIRWLDGCPVAVGRRIVALVSYRTNAPTRVWGEADTRLSIGTDLRGNGYFSAESVLTEDADDHLRLDAVAAVLYSFHSLRELDREEAWISDGEMGLPTYLADEFAEDVNNILLGARVDWHFSEGRFVRRGNSVLHADVVEPATTLLADTPEFAKASAGFQTALNRLSEEKTDVAITDAASAVQEFFRALGVNGNSISDQLNNAERAKVISPYDKSLMKPLVDWVNADRSGRGNAHHHREGDVSKADAWLMLHVAGALMVRLSNREPRDIVAARAQREAAERERQQQAAQEAAERAAEAAAREQPTAWDRKDDVPF